MLQVKEEAGSSEWQGQRKSERERRKKRTFSPDNIGPAKVTGQTKKKKKPSGSAFSSDRPYDRLPNGMPFCCDLCKSPYVCNPLASKHASRVKRSKHMPSPRFKVDELTGKMQTLCNACGLALDRPKRPKKIKAQPSQEEKDKFVLEAKMAAETLASELHIPGAEILFCPNFKMTPCECLQNYLAEEDKREIRARAERLVEIHREAKKLSALKYYDMDKMGRGKRARNIGLGNGQKKSAAYEEYVLEKREELRQTMLLCERATQKILCYSNNFLHKKLKTEERGCRAQRVKGRAARGLLRPLESLHEDKCCIDNCVRMSLSHCRLLEQWRDRATSGQQEARRVLAEMLTPSGGVRSNCYKFITWVTGCSASTIGKVNEQMKQTGGEREPPEHGLRKYWMNNPRRSASDTLSQIQGDGMSSAASSPAVKRDSIQLTSPPSQPPDIRPAPTTNTDSGQHQQQLLQHQGQLLKALEHKLAQTQMIQQTLMQQIARPEVTQNVASVQGILSQLSNLQAAATAQNPALNSSQPHNLLQNPGLNSSQLPTITIQNPALNSSQPQTIAVQTPGLNSSQPQTIAVQTPGLNSSHHHTIAVQNPGHNSSQPQTIAVQNPRLNSNQPQTIIQNPALNSSQPQTIAVQTPGLNSSHHHTIAVQNPGHNSSQPQTIAVQNPRLNSNQPQTIIQNPALNSSQPHTIAVQRVVQTPSTVAQHTLPVSTTSVTQNTHLHNQTSIRVYQSAHIQDHSSASTHQNLQNQNLQIQEQTSTQMHQNLHIQDHSSTPKPQNSQMHDHTSTATLHNVQIHVQGLTHLLQHQTKSIQTASRTSSGAQGLSGHQLTSVHGHQLTSVPVNVLQPQQKSIQTASSTSSGAQVLQSLPEHQLSSVHGHQLTSIPGHQLSSIPGHQLSSVPGHQLSSVPVLLPQSSVLTLPPNVQIKPQPYSVPGSVEPSSSVQSDHQYISSKLTHKPSESSVVSQPSVVTAEQIQPKASESQEPMNSIKVKKCPVNQVQQISLSQVVPQVNKSQVNQVQQINLCSSPQVVPQVQLQTVKPGVSLRIPFVQNQIPKTPGQQNVIVNRAQVPRFITLGQLNSEQLQSKGIQNLCIPARLPVGSPITVQQLHQIMNSQRPVELPQKQNIPPPLPQKQNIPPPLPHGNPVQQQTMHLVNHPEKSSGIVKHDEKVVTTRPRTSVQNREVASSVISAKPSNLQTYVYLGENNSNDTNRSASTTVVEAMDTTNRNVNDSSHHSLSNIAPLANIGQGHIHEQGQVSQTGNMNCTLVVQQIANQTADSVTPSTNSGHQTPSSDVEDLLKLYRQGDLDLVSPLTLPEHITRSRNNSGESIIEPSVDLASLPREFLSYFPMTFTIANGQ